MCPIRANATEESLDQRVHYILATMCKNNLHHFAPGLGAERKVLIFPMTTIPACTVRTFSRHLFRAAPCSLPPFRQIKHGKATGDEPAVPHTNQHCWWIFIIARRNGAIIPGQQQRTPLGSP